MFDNLEDPALLRDWRPTGGGARVLVTTRRGVWMASSGARAVALQPLARLDSLTLLLTPRAQATGRMVASLLATEADRQVAAAICDQVGDLPLALALAAAYLEQTPSLSLPAFAAWLAAQALSDAALTALLEEGLPTAYARGLAATLALSYARLDPALTADDLALILLQRAAQAAAAPIPARLAVRLAERDPNDATQAAEADGAVRRLAALGLARALPDGGLVVHRLVAAYARAHAPDPAGDAAALRDGLINAFNSIFRVAAGQAYQAHLAVAAERALAGATDADATLLNELGSLLDLQGDYAAARTVYERALAIREQVLKPGHSRTAQTLISLVALLENRFGDYATAQTLKERALAIAAAADEPKHPEVAADLDNPAALREASAGDYATLRMLKERALASKEQALGPDHPDIATSLTALARLLRAQGDDAAARPLYERALAIREQALGPDHPDTAASLASLAGLLRAQGDNAAARPLYERALAIYEQALGDHPLTAFSLTSLAWLCYDEAQYGDAAALMRRALAIQEAVLRPGHPDTQVSRQALARIEKKLGGNGWVRRLMRRVMRR